MMIRRLGNPGLATADQACSSASNALVLVALARSSSPADFGLASLAFVAFAALLGTVRGLLGNSLARLSGQSRRLRQDTGWALAVAAGAGLLCCAAALACVVAGDASATAVALALAPAVVLPQDLLRWYAVSDGRAGAALWSDGVWLAVVIVLVALSGRGSLSPAWVVWGWVAGGAAALAVLAALCRVRPRVRGLRGWWRADRAERLAFGLEGLVAAWNGFANLGTATLLVGAVATAGLRGAGTLFGPVALLLSALPMVVVPEVARRSTTATDGEVLWARLRPVAVGLALLALLVGSSGLWLPDGAGRAVLGETWPLARPVLPWMGLEYAGLAVVFTCGAGLRVLGHGGRLLSVRLVQSVLGLGGCLTAALVARSATAVQTALAAAALVGAVAAGRALRRSPGPGADAPTGAVVPAGRRPQPGTEPGRT